MTSAKSQQGLSFIGVLLSLAVVAFVVSTAAKVVPHYLDYMSMKKIIETIGTDRTADVTTAGGFYDYVAKGMTLNNIRDLDLKQVLSVSVGDTSFLAHLKYEKRDPLIGNIDLVVKFDHEFSVGKP